MGSAAYLTHLAKTGKAGSTLLKGLATAEKYADDVNDVSKVVYATATGQDPTSAVGNLALGQVLGYGLGKGTSYLGTKFGSQATPDLAVDLPTGGRSAVDFDLPKAGTVADSAASVAGGAKVRDLDVPKVKEVQTPDASDNAMSGRTQASSNELIPGTPEHKAQRWKEYQARENAGWSYERWSKQYDTNMQNASYGLSREQQYREILGGQSRMLKTKFTFRQVDIMDGSSLKQLKTGKVSLTKQAKIDIQKDSWLIKSGYQVEYILEKGASKPFLKALDENNIPYTIGSLIDE